MHKLGMSLRFGLQQCWVRPEMASGDKTTESCLCIMSLMPQVSLKSVRLVDPGSASGSLDQP